MEQDIIILSASQWSMTDETTGEIRKGTSLWYCYDKGKKVINEDGSCGDTPAKVSMPYEYIEEVRKRGGAPISARAVFELRTRSNKPVLEIASITFKEDEGKK